MLSSDGIFKGGKHKGERLSSPNINPSYLRFLYWQCDFGKDVDDMLIRELEHRNEPVFDDVNNQESYEAARELREAKRQEWLRRKGEKQSPPPPPPKRPAFQPISREIMNEIVIAGRQALAKRNHPDVGGDPEKMKQINITADRMLAMIGNMK